MNRKQIVRPLFVLSRQSESNEGPEKASWERLFESSWKPIAAIAVPIAVAVSPTIYKSYSLDRGVDSVIIGQALEILRNEPNPNVQDVAVRDWAIDVVARYSRTSISEDARQALLKNSIGASTIEENLLRTVSSYGRQIGILTSALIDVADTQGFQNPSLQRLRDIANEIEAAKTEASEKSLDTVDHETQIPNKDAD